MEFSKQLTDAMIAANLADDEFGKAIRDAGYKSRWDWERIDRRPLHAYIKKVQADELVHRLFEESRRRESELTATYQKLLNHDGQL